MATITATASGGTRAWSDTATWSSAAVPTAADDVVLDATSGDVTIAAAAVARSLNCAGYAGTLTHNAAVTLTLGDATAGAGNAALTLASGMTYTLGNASTSAVTFASTSTTQQSVTTAGQVLGNTTFSGSGASYLLADNLTCGTLTASGGALLTATNRTVACVTFTVTGTGSVAAIGGATFNLTSTATANVFLRTSGGSITGSTATATIVNASANTRTFAPAATGVFFTLNYTVAGSTGGLTISGAAAFTAINFSDASNGRTLTFTASTSYTITGAFNVQGSAAGAMSVVSSSAGTAATLNKTSRVVSCDYLSLKDITATGGASWYAGANSSIVSNVSGWMLTPPSNYQFLQFMAVV